MTDEGIPVFDTVVEETRMNPHDPHPRFQPEEAARLRKNLVLYSCALTVIETQLSNLNRYYSALSDSNPIELIKTRVKSVDSIAQKLSLRGLPLTVESTVENLSDIAGARVICSYSENVNEIASLIKAESDHEVIAEKDYITSPKPSGYRSYHLVVRVTPGGLFGDQSCPVEIQIRTAAMDFWATLEHKVRYKYSGEIPDHLSQELQACAEKIHELDERMYLIHELVELINQ